MAEGGGGQLSLDFKGECNLIKQGAEAKIYTMVFAGRPTIIKERFPKRYRHPSLDASLTQQRTKSEVRSMMRCRMIGIQTPAIYFVDFETHKIYMEHIVDSITVKEYITKNQEDPEVDIVKTLQPLAEKMGKILAVMHKNHIIHGDLTTSNLLLRTPTQKLELVLIDFGLGHIENVAESKGVDLYVLERAFLSTHPNTEKVFNIILDSYKKNYGKGCDDILRKLEEVRMRGRKRTMVG